MGEMQVGETYVGNCQWGNDEALFKSVFFSVRNPPKDLILEDTCLNLNQTTFNNHPLPP